MATTAGSPLILILDDEEPGPMSGPVRISASAEDTAGQTLAGWTLDVLVADGDTEGQAMTLRFPNPAAAAAFQRRLLVAGTLAGTVALGSIGAAALSNQAHVTNAGIQPAVGYAHDAEKSAVTVAPSAAERANAAAWGDATSVERARAQAAAAAAGAEAAAKAAQAAAMSGAAGAADEGDEAPAPASGNRFRGR